MDGRLLGSYREVGVRRLSINRHIAHNSRFGTDPDRDISLSGRSRPYHAALCPAYYFVGGKMGKNRVRDAKGGVSLAHTPALAGKRIAL